MTAQLTTIAVLAVSGVVLGAWYMLWLVQRIFFGPLKEPHAHANEKISDLSLREILALAPLAVFVVWIGIRPQDFLSRMQPTLELARRPAAAAFDHLQEQPEIARAR
jgi:NADH-quinone oxidoreductase subunit M